MLTFQLIASHGWTLCLGDIKGAFLEAGPLPDKYRPLFTELPPGEVPGISREALIEVTGNVYGQNDAPHNWNVVFDREALAAGFERSAFDSCLYYTQEGGKLTGVMGAHVDDTTTGGQGKVYDRAIAALRKRFPYRNWPVGSGELFGAMYTQDPSTKVIVMSQAAYSQTIRPITISQSQAQQADELATEAEIRALRGCNGTLNRLATQSRPDLSCQVSFSQQVFPSPTVSDLISANQIVRRARQFGDIRPTDCVCSLGCSFRQRQERRDASWFLDWVHD